MKATRCYRTWMIADLIAPKPDHSPPASKPKKASRPRKYLDDDEREELRKLRGEGWTLPELAAKFGIGQATAYRICHGVERG